MEPTLALACDTLQLLTAGILGLLTGALLAEGGLLVPYWRTLAPKAFYELHPTYAPRLYRFFAPLTIAAPVLSVGAATLAIAAADAGRWFSLLAAILSLAVVGIYFLYFKGTNAAFAAASIAEAELGAELRRWAAWHTRRTIVGLTAFALALAALDQPSSF